MSMMGIYLGELHVTTVPTVLPKLCIAAFCNTELEKPFKSLKMRVSSNGSVLLETTIPQGELQKMQSDVRSKNSADNHDPMKVISLGIQLQISPFAIEKETSVVVTAIADDEEIIAGRLRVKHDQSDISIER